MLNLKIFFTGLAGVFIIIGIMLWVLLTGLTEGFLWLVERERRIWRGNS